MHAAPVPPSCGPADILRPGRGRAWALRVPPWVLLGLLLLAPGSVRGAAEYEVKAAFLYNFTKFVQWPQAGDANPQQPFVIGVAGPETVARQVEAVTAGRTVLSRPITVRRVTSAQEAASSDMLFLSTQDGGGREDLLDAVRKAHVLTVGESERFSELGGMVTFAVIDGRVRFSINEGSAEKAGLKISAQLLKLATAVRREPQGP